MHADMGGAIECRARRDAPGTARSSLRPSFSSSQREELLDAQGVEHVFQPRLVAVGAVAVIDEHPHDRIGHLGGVGRLDHDAGVAREIAGGR